MTNCRDRIYFGHYMRPKINHRKLFRWIGVFLGALAITTMCFLFLFTRPSNREIAHWSSPDDGCHLIVLEGDTDWSGFPLFTKPHYYFYAGRESHNPTYGHHLSYEFHPEMAGFFENDLSIYLRKATVTWTTEGLTFEEPSGHRLFIPKAAYEGGR
jgi:hypothetical protein